MFYQKCVQSSLQMLKKQDQCSLILLSTKLYYIHNNVDFQVYFIFKFYLI